MKDEIEKEQLRLTLEQNLVYLRGIWDLFVKSKGGRASDEQIEFYRFLKGSLANSVTKLQKK